MKRSCRFSPPVMGAHEVFCGNWQAPTTSAFDQNAPEFLRNAAPLEPAVNRCKIEVRFQFTRVV